MKRMQWIERVGIFDCRKICNAMINALILVTSGHEDVGEEELEAEPASSHLKELINSGLSKLVQQEQVSTYH